jgi:hypothetical protein
MISFNQPYVQGTQSFLLASSFDLLLVILPIAKYIHTVDTDIKALFCWDTFDLSFWNLLIQFINYSSNCCGGFCC